MSTTEDQIAAEMTPDEDETEAADEDETTPDGEPDGGEEALQEAPAPRSQKEIDALTRKLEAEAERHTKRVAEIMGDDFALLVPSPVDWTPGFIFNVPEMHPTPEQIAALHALVGGAAPVELLPAEDAEGCDKCNALGQVLTGSRKPGQETKPCTSCGGVGWRHRTMPAPVVSGTNGATVSVTGGVATPETYQVKDSWGRPVGHPHFGIDPVNVGV